MFKKRNTVNKRIDVDEMLEAINTQNTEPQSAEAQKPESVPAPKNIKNTLQDIDALEEATFVQASQEGRNPRKQSHQQRSASEENEQQRREMLDCFEELKKMQVEKEQQPKPRLFGQEASLFEQNEEYNPFAEDNIAGRNGDVRAKRPVPAPIISEVIIEDDEGDRIEVREDYGQISPQASDSDDYENGFENQIIKRAMNRQAYEQLSKQLHSAHAHGKKNKLLREIDHLSFSSVQRRIARDLQAKKQARSELSNEINFIDSKIEARHKEVRDKITTQSRLEIELDKTQRVVEILYYFGSELECFDEKQLIIMSQQEYWKDRIDQLRKNIADKAAKFQEKSKLKKIKFDEEKSDGDVEQIPKHRASQAWEGWTEGEGEGEDCIQIDG